MKNITKKYTENSQFVLKEARNTNDRDFMTL